MVDNWSLNQSSISALFLNLMRPKNSLKKVKKDPHYHITTDRDHIALETTHQIIITLKKMRGNGWGVGVGGEFGVYEHKA